MGGWVATLSAEHAANWEICRRLSLFGCRAPRAADVAPGDALYFWQSGQGLFARARATASPRVVTAANRHLVPWPDAESYRYLIDMEVLDEPATPVITSWAELSALGELGRIPAPQFPPVSPSGISRIDAFFPGLNVAVDLTPSGDDETLDGIAIPPGQPIRTEHLSSSIWY